MGKNLKVLICGCTNTSHILTTILGQKDYLDIYLYSNRENQLKTFVDTQKKNKLQGVYAKYGNQSLFGKYIKAGGDLADLKQVYDIVFISLPAYGHESYLRELKPYLKKGSIIVAQPSAGHGPLLAKHALGSLYDDIVYVGNKTLPWICRLEQHGKNCNLFGVGDHNEIAVHPKEKGPEISNLLNSLIGLPRMNQIGKSTDLFPKFEHVDNFMGLTLMNANALFHPCLLYGHCSEWNKWKHYDNPIFTYKDCSDKCIDFFQKQDKEVDNIKSAILKQAPDLNLNAVYQFKKWVDNTYASLLVDTSSYKKSISSNLGLLTIKVPMVELEKNKMSPDFKHRYFKEDIPTGLLSIKDLAQLVNVKTPFIDSILKWYSMYGEEKLIEGDQIVSNVKKTWRIASLYGVKDIKEYIKLSM